MAFSNSFPAPLEVVGKDDGVQVHRKLSGLNKETMTLIDVFGMSENKLLHKSIPKSLSDAKLTFIGEVLLRIKAKYIVKKWHDNGHEIALHNHPQANLSRIKESRKRR